LQVQYCIVVNVLISTKTCTIVSLVINSHMTRWNVGKQTRCKSVNMFVLSNTMPTVYFAYVKRIDQNISIAFIVAEMRNLMKMCVKYYN
jgi:hypothetical protein